VNPQACTVTRDLYGCDFPAVSRQLSTSALQGVARNYGVEVGAYFLPFGNFVEYERFSVRVAEKDVGELEPFCGVFRSRGPGRCRRN
jgi:hypothetical protein